MPYDEFLVKKSLRGFRVELWRDGQPYVTFGDGLSQRGAEREACDLAALWRKISRRPPAPSAIGDGEGF